MRKIILTGLFAAVLAACAASAAPAMAHEFVASQNKGVIQDKGGKQVFETGLVTIQCEAETSTGVVQVKHAASNKEAVLYTGCTFGGTAAAEVSQAKYEFKAEGTVALENEVKIKVQKVECEVKIPSVGNQNLGTVSYTNSQQSGTIEINAKVEGITSTLSGTGSTCPKGETKTAKYKGASTVFFLECLPKQTGIYKDPQCTEVGGTGGYQRIPGLIYWI